VLRSGWAGGAQRRTEGRLAAPTRTPVQWCLPQHPSLSGQMFLATWIA